MQRVCVVLMLPWLAHACVLTKYADTGTLIIQPSRLDVNTTILIQSKHTASCATHCCTLEYPFTNQTQLHVYTSSHVAHLRLHHATSYAQLNTTASSVDGCLSVSWHAPARPYVLVDLTVENTIVVSMISKHALPTAVSRLPFAGPSLSKHEHQPTASSASDYGINHPERLSLAP